MARLTGRIAIYVGTLLALIAAYTVAYRWGMAALEGRPRTWYGALEIVVQSMTTTGYGQDAPWETPQMTVLMVLIGVRRRAPLPRRGGANRRLARPPRHDDELGGDRHVGHRRLLVFGGGIPRGDPRRAHDGDGLPVHRGAALSRLRHLALAGTIPAGNLFANALDPSQGVEHDAWRAQLSRDYRDPVPKISYRGALAHRLRRVYLPLIGAMLLGWIFHLWAFNPDDPFLESASLPGVSGAVVVAVVAVYFGALLVVAVPLSSKGRGESGGADHGDLEES